MSHKRMKNLGQWFEEQNTDSRKFVYAILITRHTYKNPLTSDGLITAVVYQHNGEFQPWSFNGMEDMFAWLSAVLTYGFKEAKPDWIQSRLWDEIIAHEERSAERGYKYP